MKGRGQSRRHRQQVRKTGIEKRWGRKGKRGRGRKKGGVWLGLVPKQVQHTEGGGEEGEEKRGRVSYHGNTTLLMRQRWQVYSCMSIQAKLG